MAVGKAALGKVEGMTRAILVLRGRRVLLDAELAVLYGVTTRRLNEQVRRNRKRFPDDFLFELTTGEFANLKSRFATSSWGGRLGSKLAEHDEAIAAILSAIRELMTPRNPPRRGIGFTAKLADDS
jgi:hypothetical protein